MIDRDQEHFYRNIKLSAWRTEPFESVAEQRRAQASEEYKQSPEFRETVEDKIAISAIGPMVSVGAQENRVEVATGDEMSDDEKAARKVEHEDAQAALVAELGAQAGPPPKATPAPRAKNYNGFTDDRPLSRLKINGRDIE